MSNSSCLRKDFAEHEAPQSFRERSIQFSRKRFSFSVVGEGPNRKILGYELSQMNLTDSLSAMKNTFGWLCTLCKYENVDSMNTTCSVCGNIHEESLEIENDALLLDSIDSSDSNKHGSGFTSTSSDNEVSVDSRPRQGFVRSNDESMMLGSLLMGDRRGSSSQSMPFELKLDNVPWTCTTCTFINADIGMLSCEVCDMEYTRNQEIEVADRRGSFARGQRKSLCAAMDSPFVGDMEHQIALFREFEEKALKKAQMEEIITHQKQFLSDIAPHPHGSEISQNNHWQGEPDFEELELTKITLEESRERLRFLESIHFSEKEDQENMAAFLEERKKAIEYSEGKPMEEYTGRATRPGACSVSVIALEWVAQNRLLLDWKAQWKERDDEIQALVEQERLIVDKWKKEFDISL